MIDALPKELIIKILSYLPSCDVWRMYQVSTRYRDILQSIALYRSLNIEDCIILRREDILNLLKSKVLLSQIDHLYMETLCWLRPTKLPCYALCNRTNLKTLHMLDVKVSSKQLASILSSCLELKDLSFTWPDNMKMSDLENVNPHKNIVKLKCTMRDAMSLVLFFDWVPCVQLLTVISFETAKSASFNHTPLRFGGLPVGLQHLESIQIICNNIGASLLERLEFLPSRKDVNLSCEVLISDAEINPFNCHSSYQLNEEWLSRSTVLKLPIDKFIKSKLKNIPSLQAETAVFISNFGVEGEIERLLSKMPNLRAFHIFNQPFSLSFLKKLQSKFPDLQEFGFNLISPAADRISSASFFEELLPFRHLKFLSVPFNIINDFPRERNRHRESGKLPRKEDNLINKFHKCFPVLEVFEMDCFASSGSNQLRGLASMCRWHIDDIGTFTRLTHLSLGYVRVSSGSFFYSLSENCVHLKFLRLRYLGPRGTCIYFNDMVKCLPRFHSLEHLRLEDSYLLPGTSLFASLKSCKLLRRLCLILKKEDASIDEDAFCNFVSSAPSLSFLFVYINKAPIRLVTTIKNRLKKRKFYASTFFFSNDEQCLVSKHSTISVRDWIEMVRCTPFALFPSFK